MPLLSSEQLPAASSWVQIVLAVVTLLNTALLCLLHSRASRAGSWPGTGGRSGRSSTRGHSHVEVDVELQAEGELPGDPREQSSVS